MRISLLMRREPFVTILAETLQRFWQQEYGEYCEVQWIWKPTGNQVPNSVDLLCNIYLNAIFPFGTSNGALDPIRREFSRSVVPWRTPLQRAYCQLALSARWAEWFSQAILRVSPPHKALTHQVIVPGNNKIRILDLPNGCAYGVLKQGFSTDRFENEIQARQQAEKLGIPVPKLLEHNSVAGRFKESYISGTPLNRIANATRVENITKLATSELRTLAESTKRETTVDDYITQLRTRIDHYQDQNNLLDHEQRGKIGEIVRLLASTIDDARGKRLFTAHTHGDFQPANILVDNNTFWIIDWEYAARRQLAYDGLVFRCESRRGEGLARRLHSFVIDRPAPAWLESNPEFSRQENRKQAAAILLLEELDLRLGENRNACFTQIDDGLVQLSDEIGRWINNAQ